MATIGNALCQTMSSVLCKDFFPLLAEKISVSEDKILSIWNSYLNNSESLSQIPSQIQPKISLDIPKPKKKEVKKTIGADEVSEMSATQINKLLLKELMEVSKEMGLPTKGLKANLAKNIIEKLGKDGGESIKSAPRSIPKAKKSGEKKPTQKTVLESLKPPNVSIHKNEYGRMINDDTKIIFTEDEEYIDGVRCRIAIGYQCDEDEDHDVKDLTPEKIELCNQYGFRYRLPDNIEI
jgi:hypothetical protein